MPNDIMKVAVTFVGRERLVNFFLFLVFFLEGYILGNSQSER